jgi:tryptophanyl-tRNA synthetase
VPVGEDQRQHIELTRDLAQRFNRLFGETFVVPEPHIMRETAKIYDLQNVEKQMSGSVGGSGVVWLNDDAAAIEKKIKSAVTDTGREIVYDPTTKPGVSNLLTILAAFTGEPVDRLEERLAGSGYGELKKAVAEAVLDDALPFQKRMQSYLEDEAALDEILVRGAQRAREFASTTLATAYDRVGFLPTGPRP